MKSKILIISFFAISISMVVTPLRAATANLDKREALLKPVWDGLDYFFLEPIKGIPIFFNESVDDLAEEVVKIGVFYVAYRHTRLGSASTLGKVSSFPLVYMVANLFGDLVDKRIERLQPGNENKPHRTMLADVIRKHDALGKLIKDTVEDGFKATCYASKFARGFAPSMIWAQMVQKLSGPRWATLILTAYAYFAATMKLFTDTNQCTKSSDEYASWAEDQFDKLTKKNIRPIE